MILNKRGYRAVALIMIMVLLIGFLVSPASAAPLASPSGAPNITQEVSARLQTVFTNLARQGADVSPGMADLAAGNVNDATKWLVAFHKDHPGLALNGPRMFTFDITQEVVARLNAVFNNLGQQGADVSQGKTDLAAGKVSDATQWLMAYHNANPGLALDSPREHAYNSTLAAASLQTALTTLGQQGVDISQAQADLASGNLTAAMQWMAAYHRAHPLQNGNRTAFHGANRTRQQPGGI